MSAEKLQRLTASLLHSAEKRIGITHPLLRVLDTHAPQLSVLQQEYSQLTGHAVVNNFVAERYGFLADAIVDAGPFSLDPYELVAVWSRVLEVFPERRDRMEVKQRYSFARMVSFAYGIHGETNTLWKTAPRYYHESDHETSELPEGLRGDTEGMRRVKNRVASLGQNIRVIRKFVAEAIDREDISDDDKRFTEYGSVVYQVGENFGNGLPVITMMLDRHIEQNERNTDVSA